MRAWVSYYQALPDLDENANAVAIQTLKLENEGWERDYSVTEPSEPQFVEPKDARAGWGDPPAWERAGSAETG